MRKINIALLFLIIYYSAGYTYDLIIKESSDQSTIIEFSPQKWFIKDRIINEKSYKSIRFESDNITVKTGQPMVPGKVAIIGIPLEARVDYQVIEINLSDKLSGKLIPMPTSHPSQEYFEDETFYNSSKIFPSNVIQLENPGFIRNQRVICLKLFPVQYNTQKNEIQLIEKIVVKLRFTGARVSNNAIKNMKDESFYRGAILNYDQAKNWRQQPTIGTVKRRNISLANNWYKIFVKNEGIYKVTGKMLSDNGIQINEIDPSTIQIYNNGGKELVRAVTIPRPDSLIENAIMVVDNNDGKFDESDYFLFYAKSVEGWNYNYVTKTFSHYINHYTEKNVFWLTWGKNKNGKRMAAVSLPVDNQIPLQTSFRDHLFLEEEYYNLIDSGIDWYGKVFSNNGNPTESKTFAFNLKGAISQDSAEVKLKLAGISAGYHRFNFYMNQHYLGRLDFTGSYQKYTIVITDSVSLNKNNILIDGYNDLRLDYLVEHIYSKAYLDWIELHFWRNLIANEDKLLFYSPVHAGSYRYQVSDFSKDELYIFDITEYYDVRRFENLNISDGTVVFVDTVNSKTPKRYLALTPDKFLSPLHIEEDVTSNLRTLSREVDFIIIAHDDFYDQALELKNHREGYENLKTEVAKISDVYDEFSWGLFDPVAIRDFIKYAYHNWHQPEYVLLLGSGDFDYRNIINPVDHNWIPPFQTTENYESESRAMDDWYVCVHDDNYLDLSIGRLPVRNPTHASNVVKKIIDYQKTPLYGDWRNTITLVADDVTGEDVEFIEREHTNEAENIAENYLPNSFNVNKIYLVEYPGVYTASITGTRKPAAQQDIIDTINQGCLIINYFGHGRYDLWAHEVVLEMDQDLQRINCENKQAFWIAGTCYFGRFDNPDYESMSEELVLLEDNGAIAVLAAARLVSSAPNIAFTKKLYGKLFPSAYHKIRLGNAISTTKNSRGNPEDDQKLILFGDPTLILANPAYQATIYKSDPDSIKALSQLNISGVILKDGSTWHNFNGNILLKAYDSKKNRIYVIKENDVLNYLLPGNTIFRGTATVQNGEFNLKFIVPKDITYGGKSGRFSVYFWNDEVDGSGFKNSIPVGGTSTNILDNEGPQITIDFNGKDFYDGGMTNQNPVLSIEITDSSGVNIAGDIGHSIVLILDDEKINVTDLFNYYNNNYVSGSINYAPGFLAEGSHSILVKAWDNCNNSSEINAAFIVVANEKLTIRKVMNYPNPFSNNTEFTFWINLDCETTIKIYTIAGRLIKKIDDVYASNGFNRIFWDGHDHDGDRMANGVYLYKICAKAQYEGKTISTEVVDKLMIIR